MELFYKKTGKGRPFIILHGLYGSSDNWIAISRKLAANYTVYSIDLRNHGQSPHHPEHSYEAMKEDIAYFFTQNKIDSAVIMGHSMGGKVAMLFAAEYPELVKKLIIVDIAPKDYMALGDESQFYFHQSILQAMIGVNFDYVKSRRDVEDVLNEKVDNSRVVQFLMKNVETEKSPKRLKWRLNIDALYNYLEEIVEGGNYKRFEDRIPITSYPVIFIRGLLSHYIKDKDIPLLKRIYPDCDIVDIADAGHWLHADQPEIFIETVLRCC